jgi:hypothetical protein
LNKPDRYLLAVLLERLGEELPAPRIPRWQLETSSGLAPAKTPETWHKCEQCKDGRTKKGACGNCGGLGGWHIDPYDSDERRLATDGAALRCMTAAEMDRWLHATTDTGDGNSDDEHEEPKWRRQLLGALDAMRATPHAAVLITVHVLHLVSVQSLEERQLALYEAAMQMLADLLGPDYPAPRSARDRAAVDRDTVRAARAREERWPDRTVRDAEIHRLTLQGRSARWIAKRLRIDRATVARVMA